MPMHPTTRQLYYVNKVYP